MNTELQEINVLTAQKSWFCGKHKVRIAGGKPCPLCLEEENNKEFIRNYRSERIKKALQEKKEREDRKRFLKKFKKQNKKQKKKKSPEEKLEERRNYQRNYQRKRFQDPEYRKHKYEIHKKWLKKTMADPEKAEKYRQKRRGYYYKNRKKIMDACSLLAKRHEET